MSLAFASLTFLLWSFFLPSKEADEARVQRLFAAFNTGYQELQLPEFGYSYQDNLRHIRDAADLRQQQQFFDSYRQQLSAIRRSNLRPGTRYDYDHLQYEVALNLERVRLEQRYRQSAAAVPATGLHALPDSRDWYRYYVRRLTSVNLSPEELLALGQQEVAHVQAQISRLRAQLGYAQDSAGFYRHLQEPQFTLTDKAQVLARYDSIKATAYRHLPHFVQDTAIPDVEVREIPNAGPLTVPGYYVNPEDSPSGKGIFYFNFYGNRHNLRQTDWIFLHEAVPGHHYQFSTRSKLPQGPLFRQLFYYPGNFEGWAAYVEDYGKDLGLYQDPYQELGKWEWDLVRSARVVLDVGIHAQGWTQEQALAYWKRTIPGADDIAEREVKRVTSWPAQVLTYKVGQDRLRKLRAWAQAAQGAKFDQRLFHALVLQNGQRPLPVVEQMVKETLKGNRS